MANPSIKNMPEAVVGRLRARAWANRRSLQGELLDLACRAADANESGTLPYGDGDEDIH